MTKRRKLLATSLVGLSACCFGAAFSTAIPVSATTALDLHAQSFVMDNGAKILYDGENTGLRFTAYMNSEEYQTLLALNSDTVSVSFGVIVMPYDYVTEGKELTEANLFGENKKYCLEDKATCTCNLTHVSHYESATLYEDAEKYPNMSVISCSLIDILQDNMPRPFVGVGYVAYEDATNPNAVVYDYKLASFYNGDVKNNVRSALYVAQATYEKTENLTAEQKKTIEDMYFAPYVGKNFAYTVNYNVLDKSGNVVKTESALKFAPFNTKISAPAYDGTDEVFGKLTKVQDDTQYLIYNENRTVINVNYVNDVKPELVGEVEEIAFVDEAFAIDFTATDVFGENVTVTKTLVSSDLTETVVTGNEFTFDTAGVYTLNVTATDENGNVAEKSVKITVLSGEGYGDKVKVNAFDNVNQIVGRAGDGWSPSNYSFNDAGGYSASWLTTTTEFSEQLAGKPPAVKYSRKAGQTGYMTVRIGLQPVLSKTDLIAYQKYSGLDTLYLEFYNEHLQYPGDKGKVMRKLVGVDENGAGVYENFQVASSTWTTLSYDLDMLIEYYDTIFYAEKAWNTLTGEEYYGLVLLAAGGISSESSAAVMNDQQNSYYVGNIYLSNEENRANEKYMGVQKLSAISGIDDIAARGYVGNSEIVHTTFTDEGGCAAAWLSSSVPTEALAGKVPTVKYSVLENKYLAARFGIQPTVSKAELEKYKKFSGLTKLCIEYYNEHTRWTSAVKLMKVLRDVDENGAGVYEIIQVKSGEWTTIELDINLLIEHYDTIFNPSVPHTQKPNAGLCLIASANTYEGSSADMVNWQNAYYFGEIYFA